MNTIVSVCREFLQITKLDADSSKDLRSSVKEGTVLLRTFIVGRGPKLSLIIGMFLNFNRM